MRKLRLVNVYLHLYELNIPAESFSVGKYEIYPDVGCIINLRKRRKHQQNSYVAFSGKQPNSVLFLNGKVIDPLRPHKERKRKFIDDILIVGSLLSGYNWGQYSTKKDSSFQWSPRSNLVDFISTLDKAIIEDYFQKAIISLTDPTWKKQYDNGFHLKMLYNFANITGIESRFLANVIIWEWMYPHLKNPNGATIHDEERKGLMRFIEFILNENFPSKTFDFDKKDKEKNSMNVFYIIRNQLTHSGRLPINRKDAQKWMKKLSIPDIYSHMEFFNQLTQVIVLKTLNIDVEEIFKKNFDLDYVLETGSLIKGKNYYGNLEKKCQLEKKIR